ncbi:MAG: TonB-dependent receptor, partial [Gammaproteobacteria bacterium]|nr:TonB-dependent receptor [Gammaproteobacteria bacterium]
SVQGSSPAVAMYLDEQPVAFGGRNLDIYAADLERVEVLPGPQGTLFGASSQSGTVRLITKKPSVDGFKASVSAGYSTTSGGDSSSVGEAAINVPLSDSVAARVVVYNDNQGGWIDNIPSRFNPNGLDLINVINRNQISGSAAVLPTASLPNSNNAAVVEDDWNDASYKGARLSLSWDINEDWNLLVQHTDQELETEGAFEFSPVTGTTDSSQVFTPDRNTDSFGLTTWTVDGRLGELDVLYTGGFLNREVNSLLDYTTYSFGGGYQVYYITTGGYSSGNQVYDFAKQYVDDTTNERTTHEFRIQGEIGERVKYTAGVYIDESITESTGQFQYFGAVAAGFDVASVGGDASVRGVTNPTGRGQNTIFVNDFTRDEEQVAFFADASFDITDQFSLSIGARNYDIDFALLGSTGSSFGCKGVDPATLPASRPAGQGGSVAALRPDGTVGCDGKNFDNNVTARLQRLGATGTVPNLGADGVANQSDTIFRVTTDWKMSDDVMLFATWSEGFRPQVSNRNAGVPSGNQSGVFAGYAVPAIASTDELENFELGVKGDFLDGRMRLNATFYKSDITNLQTARFDPSNIAFLVFIENVGDAEVTGLDLDYAWAATDNLTISGAASFVDSEITRLNPQLVGLSAPVGSELPFAADFSFNIRGRYDFEWEKMGAQAYVQGALVYTGDSKAGIIGNAYFAEDTTRRIYGVGTGLTIADEGGTFGATRVATEIPGSFGLTGDGQFFKNGRYVQESYSLFNLAAGFDKDNWGAELYINNLFDEDAITHISTQDYVPTASVARPRTIGIRFKANFE